jgi:hypothetical protein
MAKGTSLEDLKGNAALQNLLLDPNFKPQRK